MSCRGGLILIERVEIEREQMGNWFNSEMYHCTPALLAYLSFERDYFPVHGAEHLYALRARSHGSEIIVIDVHAARRASLVPSAQWGSTLRRATSGPQRARAPEYNTNQQLTHCKSFIYTHIMMIDRTRFYL